MVHEFPLHILVLTLDPGDVMYFNCLGRSIIVLCSNQAAVDLLDKRSGNYSDRPRFVVWEMLVYLLSHQPPFLTMLYLGFAWSRMGWEISLTLLPYGKRFQKQRKLFQLYHEPDCLYRILFFSD
jgi:hypothetical protein